MTPTQRERLERAHTKAGAIALLLGAALRADRAALPALLAVEGPLERLWSSLTASAGPELLVLLEAMPKRAKRADVVDLAAFRAARAAR